MKATVIFKELREFCEANADDAIVKKYSRYFKDNYNAYGVASPLLSADTELFLLKYKDSAPRLIFQYACEKMTAEEKQRFKRAK
jgi:hypothetical protein